MFFYLAYSSLRICNSQGKDLGIFVIYEIWWSIVTSVVIDISENCLILKYKMMLQFIIESLKIVCFTARFPQIIPLSGFSFLVIFFLGMPYHHKIGCCCVYSGSDFDYMT